MPLDIILSLGECKRVVAVSDARTIRDCAAAITHRALRRINRQFGRRGRLPSPPPQFAKQNQRSAADQAADKQLHSAGHRCERPM